MKITQMTSKQENRILKVGDLIDDGYKQYLVIKFGLDGKYGVCSLSRNLVNGNYDTLEELTERILEESYTITPSDKLELIIHN